MGQIVGEVGKGWLETGRNRLRNILQVRLAIDTTLRSEAAYLNVVEREDDWLQFKMNARFEPVLPRDGDPFVVGEEGICGPEIVGRRESKVGGLADGGEDVEVGEGREDEDKDDGFYGGKRSARC